VPERALPSLPDLLTEPARALELASGEAVSLLAQVGALAEVLRIAAARSSANGEQPKASEDGLLTLEQGARIACVSAEQLRRRRSFRPCIVRLGHRMLRVNERKLRAILARMGA
jgi:hypothetical protein